MKSSAIAKKRSLHAEVIHGSCSTEAQYLAEDRMIRQIPTQSLLLTLICETCFPSRLPVGKFSTDFKVADNQSFSKSILPVEME